MCQQDGLLATATFLTMINAEGVENGGVEPPTFSMPSRHSTS